MRVFRFDHIFYGAARTNLDVRRVGIDRLDESTLVLAAEGVGTRILDDLQARSIPERRIKSNSNYEISVTFWLPKKVSCMGDNEGTSSFDEWKQPNITNRGCYFKISSMLTLYT